jgi:hypothetical protein
MAPEPKYKALLNGRFGKALLVAEVATLLGTGKFSFPCVRLAWFAAPCALRSSGRYSYRTRCTVKGGSVEPE